MRTLVFGTGSLGTLVSGLFAPIHDVTLVARDPYATRMSAAGLDIIGTGSIHISPAATTADTSHSTDLAFVMIRSFDTTAAADAFADCDADAVLSLQNGLTEETFASRPSTPVLTGTMTYETRLVEPSRVEYTDVGRIILDAFDGGPDPLTERVGKVFRDAGFNTLVATDVPRRHWEKLAVNAGINTITALARVENGTLAGDDTGELAHRITHETTRVARLEHVSLPNRVAREAIDRMVEGTTANRPSMLQDMTAEKRTEVDAVNGAVVDIAADHDFEVPTNRTLAALPRAWERGAGLR